MKRKIVRIDEGKCNGCGLCVDACAEGAIELVDGKARLVSDIYCDGLGACLGECPQGAITIEEREAGSFDENAVRDRLSASGKKPEKAGGHHGHSGGGCPGSRAFEFGKDRKAKGSADSAGPAHSELAQWPVQLHLVPVRAPYWNGADILVCADCVAFAADNFQSEFLKGRKLVIACPKLDETSEYAEKLAAIFRENDIRSVMVARMEVPCCGGIAAITEEALKISGKQIPLRTVIVGIDGGAR